MSLDNINRLKHMLDAAREAQIFMQDVTFESLPSDRKTIQAVIRSIEIIGEAATKISEEFKKKHPDIPWREIVGMRNWLIHAYYNVDIEHIWNTVHQDLPVLIPQLERYLKEVE